MHVFLQYYVALIFSAPTWPFKRMYFLRYECSAYIPEECIGEAVHLLNEGKEYFFVDYLFRNTILLLVMYNVKQMGISLN